MFISVVPSVWHILVRVCCDAEFLTYFFRLDFTDSRRLQWPPCRTEECFANRANCISRMPSIVFDAHTVGIGCKNQVCNMSVHYYECRDWSDSYRLALPHS